MASKIALSDVNELLDCPVCFQKFSQTNLPKLLPCSHSVCTPCLQGIVVGQNLSCPMCRNQIEVTRGDVNTLITNLTILQLADIPVIGKCNVCRRERKTSKCLHCVQKLCAECLNKHTAETERKMRQLQHQLNTTLKDAEDFKQKLEGEKTSMESSAAKQADQIHNQFDTLMEQLQSRRDYLITEVNTNVESMMQKYEKIENLLEQKIIPLRSTLNDLRRMLTEARCNLAKKTIDETYSTGTRIITELGQTLPRCTLDFPKIVVQAQMDDLVAEIEQWGKVTSEKGVRVQYRPPKTAALSRVPRPASQIFRQSIVYPAEPTPEQPGVDYTQRGRLERRLQTWQSGGRQQRFGGQLGVAVDAVSGEMFVADEAPSHQVHVFTSSGQYVRSFGGEGSSLGQFKLPCGVEVNHNREVIVCDYYNHRCQKFTHTGKNIMQFGECGSGEGALNMPTDVTVDDNNNVYVTSCWGHCVKVYSNDGTYSRSFGTRASGTGQFERPRYIQWSRGNCVVCDENGVQLWSDGGKFIRHIGARGDHKPLIAAKGVSTDQHGHLLIVDVGDHTVNVYSSDGQFVSTFPVDECQAGLANECYLMCTPEGAVIVSDSKSQSVLSY